MDVNFNSSGVTAGGTSFVSLLQVLFIGLKLCGVIDWSWWWVLAPTWISISLVILIIIIVLIVVAIKKHKNKSKGW